MTSAAADMVCFIYHYMEQTSNKQKKQAVSPTLSSSTQPVLDAKGYDICDAKGYAIYPDCGTRVNSGPSGLRNLE